VSSLSRWFPRGARLALASVVFGACAACIGSSASRGLSSEDKAVLDGLAVAAVPADATPVDVDFDGKIHLVGYRMTPAMAPPGTEVRVTYYWRVDTPLEDGWILYSHLSDPRSGQDLNLDDNGPIRKRKDDQSAIMPPSKWDKGKIYTDQQTFTIPEWGDNMGSEVKMQTGFWSLTQNRRLPILSGPNEAGNAFALVRFATGKKPGQPARPTFPELRVPKLPATEKIVIDGRLDESAWKGAAATGEFVNVSNGTPNTGLPAGFAKLLWDETKLYVGFEVRDQSVSGPFTDPKSQPQDWTTTGQPKLWTKDTVEIMIDPEGDGDNVDYYELQVNPQNKVFHTQYDGYNTPKVDPNGPFGHEDWDPKLQSAVTIRGTINSPSDKDEGYTVEIAIPWASMTKAKKKLTDGAEPLRMNFYAMEDNGGAAWSPILGQGNFHKASRFGRVYLLGAKAEAKDVGDAGVQGDGGGVGDAGGLPKLLLDKRGTVRFRPYGSSTAPKVP
jgi:Carbohydrate family 9 binding domain-like